MKYTALLLATGTSLVAAQQISTMAQCGQFCFNSMIEKAPVEFGCKRNDFLCYCCDERFGYGIRDCANSHCQLVADKANTLGYGRDFCESAKASRTCPPKGQAGSPPAGENNNNNNNNQPPPAPPANPPPPANNPPPPANNPPPPANNNPPPPANNPSPPQQPEPAPMPVPAPGGDGGNGGMNNNQGGQGGMGGYQPSNPNNNNNNNPQGGGQGGQGGNTGGNNNNQNGGSNGPEEDVTVTVQPDSTDSPTAGATGGAAMMTAAPMLGVGAMAAMLLL